MKTFNEWFNKKENIISESNNIESVDKILSSVPKSMYMVMSVNEITKLKSMINKTFYKKLDKVINLAESYLRHLYAERWFFEELSKLNLEYKNKNKNSGEFVKKVEPIIYTIDKVYKARNKEESEFNMLSQDIMNDAYKSDLNDDYNILSKALHDIDTKKIMLEKNIYKIDFK